MRQDPPSLSSPPELGPPASYFYCLWIEARDGDLIQHAYDPVEFYGELDASRWAIRCVRKFRDGSITAHSYEDPDWREEMPEAPVTPADELNAEPEFDAKEIAAEEFEAVWTAARAAT